MWDVPGPGIEPVSPALAGGFLTTGPPGKSPNLLIFILNTKINVHTRVMICGIQQTLHALEDSLELI